MIGDKLYFFQLTHCEGTIGETFEGRDFSPSTPSYQWPWFRVINGNKNEAIDEMIAKLKSLKD